MNCLKVITPQRPSALIRSVPANNCQIATVPRKYCGHSAPASLSERPADRARSHLNGIYRTINNTTNDVGGIYRTINNTTNDAMFIEIG